MENQNSKKIEKFLLKMNFSKEETKIYITLLEKGALHGSKLERLIGIPRTTLERKLTKLINRGLISKTHKDNRKKLIAEEPSKLELILREQEIDDKSKLDQTRGLQANLGSIIELLKKSIPNDYSTTNTQVKYYEGLKAVQNVYKLVLTAHQIYSIVNLDKVYNTFEENRELFFNTLKKGNLEMWEIAEVSEESKALIKRNKGLKYHYRFVPKEVSFSNFDFMIFDDSIAMIHIDMNNPYAVVMKSKEMAEGLKAIFKIVWDVL